MKKKIPRQSSFIIRTTKELHDFAKEIASKEGRSLNQMVIAMIKRRLTK